MCLPKILCGLHLFMLSLYVKVMDVIIELLNPPDLAPLPALLLLLIHISRSIDAQNLTCVDDQYSYERDTFPSQQGLHMCWLWSYLVISAPPKGLFTLYVTSPTEDGPPASDKTFYMYVSAYVRIIRHQPEPTDRVRRNVLTCRY
jgi:hypothetical protein